MEKAFKRALETYYNNAPRIYIEIQQNTCNLRCTPVDVSLFAIASLPKFEKITGFDQIAGLFLSAIINSRKENDFTIDLSGIETPIDYVGYKNTKNVVVNSDVGSSAGCSMEKGTLTIFGNAGSWLGDELKGGAILLHGNAEEVGSEMTGGEITVNGNIQSTGTIYGGRVVVNGLITAFSGHNKGEVWQNDVQISTAEKVLRWPKHK